MSVGKIKNDIRRHMSKLNYAIDLKPMFDELDKLEAKAAELDRIEKGVEVTEFNEPCWYIGCSRCESVATGTYCSVCGTKLIWTAK